jgi:tetratricopeptide (TPR) repeat protein
MRKTIFLVLGFFACIQARSQESNLLKELEIKILNGQNDSAIIIADEILETDSLSWIASFYKGKAMYSKYKYFDALCLFKNANLLDTANYIIENALAESYDAIGDDEAAIQIYYDQYLRDTNKIEPIVRLANIFRKTKEYGSAIHYYQKASSIDPENFYYYKQQGYCINKINMPAPAIFAYQTAIGLNPYDAKMYHQLANLQNSERYFADAISTCNNGLSKYPFDQQLMKLKAYAYYLNRDFDSSIVVFNKILELGDTSFFNLKYLGLTHFEKKEFVNAIKKLELAYEYNEEDAETCFFLGSAFARSGNEKKGLEFLNISLRRIMPPSTELSNIYSEMAYTYLNQKKYSKSLESLKLAYKNESKPILSFKMAQLYDYYLDNRKLAIEYYKGYLIMTVPSDSDQENAGVTSSFLADNRVIENAKERIRILKEEMFFEGDNKK